MNGFGHRLENLREKHGYSQKEVSLKLGYSPNAYGNYEREDRIPSYDTLKELSALYNVSVDYIITGRDYVPTPKTTTMKMEAIQELLKVLAEKGIEDPYFLQIEKWSILNEEDIKDLSSHFEWTYQKAQLRD